MLSRTDQAQMLKLFSLEPHATQHNPSQNVSWGSFAWEVDRKQTKEHKEMKKAKGKNWLSKVPQELEVGRVVIIQLHQMLEEKQSCGNSNYESQRGKQLKELSKPNQESGLLFKATSSLDTLQFHYVV